MGVGPIADETTRESSQYQAGKVLTFASAKSADNCVYIAHRGGAKLHPEHTMAAYRAIVAGGAKAIECDVYPLRDGGLGVMHDDTLTRTTTSTGYTIYQTSASWQGLVVDDGARVGGIYTSLTYPAPLLDEVVREFGNKVMLYIEAKIAGTGSLITSLLQRYGIRTDMACVTSFILSELTAAATAGYRTQMTEPVESLATLTAAGITEIVYNSATVADATITAAVAAGFAVGVYTIDRHYDRDRFKALGCTIFYSDDPVYLSGGHVRLVEDPFDSRHWYHGMSNMNTSNSSLRGSFTSDGHFLVSNSGAILAGAQQGWTSPITNPTAFTMDFSVKWTSADTATRWFAVDIMVDDRGSTQVVFGANGYRFLARKNGNVEIFKGAAAGAGTLIGTAAGTVTSISDGATATYRITVTSTTVRFERKDVANGITVTDSTYRGGYVAFGVDQAIAEVFDWTLS